MPIEGDGGAGRALKVTWMDHEVGSNQLAADQVVWDWFRPQLHDGRDIKLYVLRSENGTSDYASGTVIAGDGPPRFLTSDWTTCVTRRWRSAVPSPSCPKPFHPQQ